MPRIPLRHHRQKFLYLALIADEVVVHDKNRTAPLARVKLIEFGHHLRRRFHPRFAAIDLDDVAKFAIERAAARILDGHGAVIFRVDQIEIRQRRGVQSRQLRGLVKRLGGSAFEIGRESGDQFLGFADHNVIGIQRQILHATADRSTHHRAQPARAAAGQDPQHAVLSAPAWR